MTPEGYDQVFDRIVPAAQKLAKEGANAISVMGTSLTFYKGAAFNDELIKSVKKATGLPSTTMSTGIVEGLKAAGARRRRGHHRVQRRGEPASRGYFSDCCRV